MASRSENRYLWPERLKRLTCLVSGEHDYRMRERAGRVFLECQQCGGQSPGWESTRPAREAAPSSRRQPTDPAAGTTPAASNPDDRQERVDAGEFLREILADGPIKQADAIKRARERGIADRTLRRARRRIGAVALKQGFGRGSFWLWRLAPRHPQIAAPLLIRRCVLYGCPSGAT